MFLPAWILSRVGPRWNIIRQAVILRAVERVVKLVLDVCPSLPRWSKVVLILISTLPGRSKVILICRKLEHHWRGFLVGFHIWLLVILTRPFFIVVLSCLPGAPRVILIDPGGFFQGVVQGLISRCLLCGPPNWFLIFSGFSVGV